MTAPTAFKIIDEVLEGGFGERQGLQVNHQVVCENYLSSVAGLTEVLEDLRFLFRSKAVRGLPD